MSQRFLAAAIQFGASSDKDANFATAARLARAAAGRGAALIVLPELFFWRGGRDDERAAAEPIPGPTTDRLASLAAELRVHLVGGSLLEAVPGADKAYNTCPVFDPARRAARHLPQAAPVRRRHPRPCHRARVRHPAHGARAVTVRTELGTLGLSICYDLRFPELYRALGAAGAEIVCVPSAFTFPTGAHHWEVLLRARAIENQVYVVAPNQIGRGASGVLDYGHSLIVDPWGTPIARASNRDTVVLAEIDLDYLARVRRELPCLAHRTLPA